MSIILDALSRAERERRSSGVAPDILAVTPQPQQRSSAFFLILGAALALLATILWNLGAGLGFDVDAGVDESHHKSDAVDPASGRISETQRDDFANTENPAQLSVAPPQDTQQITTEAPARTTPSAAITALYGQPASSQADKDPTKSAAIDALTRSTQATQSSIDESRDQKSETAGQGATDLDPQEIFEEARAVAASSGLAPHPVPLLMDLSKQYRDEVPTLIYLRHDFNSAEVSSVRINGEDLRVGQRTRQVMVREILSDSVILRFKDKEFRLRALNSWVNL